MSATRDPSQKIAFVYSNLYQIYKDGVTEAKASPTGASVPGLPISGYVIKADHHAPAVSPPAPPRVVRPYSPAELIGKRIARPESISKPSLESLKQNLKNLNDLHSRLKFMLAELEELTRG